MPDFVSLPPNGESFFTEGGKTALQQWDVQSRELRFTYKRPATSLSFLDDDIFFSTHYNSSKVHVWKQNEEEPTQTLELESDIASVLLAMTQTIFLIGGAGGVVKCFALSENEWKPTFTFQEHTGWIRSLTKVNESMFVSTSGDCTAKLWDLRNQSSSLFTFRGHTDPVYSSVFL